MSVGRLRKSPARFGASRPRVKQMDVFQRNAEGEYELKSVPVNPRVSKEWVMRPSYIKKQEEPQGTLYSWASEKYTPTKEPTFI